MTRRFQAPKANKGRRLDVATSSSQSTNSQYPAFCLAHAQKGYSITECSRDEQAQFAQQIQKLSTMPWGQIMSADRHGLGHEKIARGSLRKPVPDCVTADVPILAFRFCAKKPMIGFRRDQIFYVLWIDPRFEIYKH